MRYKTNELGINFLSMSERNDYVGLINDVPNILNEDNVKFLNEIYESKIKDYIISVIKKRYRKTAEKRFEEYAKIDHIDIVPEFLNKHRIIIFINEYMENRKEEFFDSTALLFNILVDFNTKTILNMD